MLSKLLITFYTMANNRNIIAELNDRSSRYNYDSEI